MFIDELDKSVLEQTENIRNIQDAKEVIKELLGHMLTLEQQLNDILKNLNSDNIVEIDFGKTKYTNYKNTILKKCVSGSDFDKFKKECDIKYVAKG